jgi:hypothetical protein
MLGTGQRAGKTRGTSSFGAPQDFEILKSFVALPLISEADRPPNIPKLRDTLVHSRSKEVRYGPADLARTSQ